MDPTPTPRTTRDDSTGTRPLALVTGASSGIGLELARVFGEHGFDVIVVAAGDGIEAAATDLESTGAGIVPVRADLTTFEGVNELYRQMQTTDRPLDVLAINAGVGVGGKFAETDLDAHLELIRLNVMGAVHLTRLVLPDMVARRSGRILFTSSIAAMMPGPYESTYAASKAFLYSFAQAIRAEVAEDGVTVTSLLPGPTDTNFFTRADMEDTKVGRAKKDDPADVARDGFEALMKDDDHVVAGSVKNRVQVAAARVLPDTAAAAMHGTMSKPDSER